VRRTGIDLSSTQCHVVDVEASGRRRKGEAGAIKVRHCASLSVDGGEDALAAELKALVEQKLLPRRAWVSLWDLRSSHQYILLPSAPVSDLELMTRRHAASMLGMSDAEVIVATTIGSTRGVPGHGTKTEVAYFAAGADDVRRRLRPFLTAGFLVEGVTTPCGALWSQARLRRESWPSGVHAHVALSATQSAIGIFADGALLYARDLDWGYAQATDDLQAPQGREALAARLSAELRRSFLYVKQYWDDDISQVLLCGEMAEMRSLTAPLIERLNLEVETLDTLDGFDTSSLPDAFADQPARFRLATSVAVEPPPVNLLPAEPAAREAARPDPRVLAAGMLAAVAFGAVLYAQANVARVEAERQLAIVQEDALRARRAAALPAVGERAAMARPLDVLALAAPRGVTVTSILAVPEGDHWGVAIEAQATGPDHASARAKADEFLQTVRRSGVFQ